MKFIRILALLAIVPAVAGAQAPASTDTIFDRAQHLMSDGQGDAARQLVQRELNAAPTGSARFLEALYWRAVVAETEAEAERDLRRLVVEFPLAARTPDALTRLGQLELARGNSASATRYFERLALEHGGTPETAARANYWLARSLLEEGSLARACTHLGTAREATPGSQVELRNQIDYYSQRCTPEAIAAAPQRPSAAPAAGQATPAQPRPTTPAPTTTRPAQTTQATPSPAIPARPGATEFTVQVAALRTRAEADRLRTTLEGRGFTGARVVQVGTLWRVRVGRFPTREAARAEGERLKQRGFDSFVTEAEPR